MGVLIQRKAMVLKVNMIGLTVIFEQLRALWEGPTSFRDGILALLTVRMQRNAVNMVSN